MINNKIFYSLFFDQKESLLKLVNRFTKKGALIRPGWIDKKLMLGYMKFSDIIFVLEHYFEVTLSQVQKERKSNAMQGNSTKDTSPLTLTLAQIEQMTVEYENIDDMIEMLEKRRKFKHSMF